MMSKYFLSTGASYANQNCNIRTIAHGRRRSTYVHMCIPYTCAKRDEQTARKPAATETAKAAISGTRAARRIPTLSWGPAVPAT